jgi:cytochrome b subunit of formate dehydrogenase
MTLAPLRAHAASKCWPALLSVLALALPLSAQESSDCLACHADPDIVQGRLLFDEAAFAASVHPGADCIDCHIDLYGVESFPHAKELAPADCGDCHDEELPSMADYWGGTHGRLVREGSANAPLCADCHGGHDIRRRTDPLSRAFAVNVPAMCTQCHANGSTVERTPDLERSEIVERYKDRIHGSQFFAMGLKVTALCTSCHGHHGVLPATDPNSKIHKDKVNQTCTACHGAVESVHQVIIAPELWQQPSQMPICVDCHIPHSQRQVSYGTNMNDQECLACHSSPTVGAPPTPQIDVAGHQASVHGRNLVACAMCHTGVTPSEGRSCATITAKVNCALCHQATVEQYEDGVHGKLHGDGDPNAPACVDCHGNHDILESRLDPLNPPPEDLRARILQAPTHRRNVPDLCARCHREGAPAALRHPGTDPKKVEHYRMSIHGKGLLESGLIASANCVDCHSAHKELPLTDPESTVHPDNIVATCSRCHDGIHEQFRNSVHATGVGFTRDLPSANTTDLPQCNNCHSSHTVTRADQPEFQTLIVAQCGQCHERITETYMDTYHGKVSELGDTLVARCHDCHESHNMLAADSPGSSLHPDNIVATCGKCHPGSHESFTGYLAHGTHNDPERYPALYWSFLGMTVLLVGVFSFFGLHLIAWIPRSVILRRQHRKTLDAATQTGAKQYRRFNLYNRVLHIMIVVSFLGLTLTGMALKFAEADWAKVLATILGGPATAGWIHRFCAVITFAYFGLHVFDVLRRYRRKSVSAKQFFLGPTSMIPTWQDVKDFVATIKWFFGMGPRPRYGMWTYWEKFDYFAVFWGVAVIGLSGLVLWFPVTATYLMPGWMLNVATIIHSEEALLAAGFIFTMHFFNTHLRPEKFPMDRVVFTGRMTVEELKHDKPRLYEQLVANGELEDHLVDPPTPRAERFARIFGFTALTIGIITVILIVHGLLTVGL